MQGKLQVISGAFRGKKLHIPGVGRPTQQKTRGAVFNMLAEIVHSTQYTVHSTVVWDAFAGSGALGIEFISRFTAKTAIFTDTDPDAIACIRKNTESITDCDVIVRQESALNYKLPDGQLVVFIDPPYSAPELGEKLVEKLGKTAPKGTIVVWEVENNLSRRSPGEGGWNVVKNKTHGRARILILRKV